MATVDKIRGKKAEMESQISRILSKFLKSRKAIKNGEVITDISQAKDGVAYVILNLEYNHSASKAMVEVCGDWSREFSRFPKEFATKHLSKTFSSDLTELEEVMNECITAYSLEELEPEEGDDDGIELVPDNPIKLKIREIEELNKIFQILDKPVKESIKALVDMGYESYLEDMDSEEYSYMYSVNMLVPVGLVSEFDIITEEEYDNIPQGGGGGGKW